MATCKELTHPDLVCAICREIFKRPTTLPCGHTTCFACQVAYAQSNTETIKKKAIPCSYCRQWNKVPGGITRGSVKSWVEQFKPSITIQNLINAENSEEQLAVSPEPSHQVGKVCTEHPTQNLELFCRTCDKPICPMCGAFTHKECKGVIQLSTRSGELKAFVTEEIEKFSADKTKMEAHVSSIQTKLENFLTECNQTEQKIKQQVKALRDFISVKEDELLKKLEIFRRKNESDMSTSLEDVGNTVKIMNDTTEKSQADANLSSFEAYEHFKSIEHDVSNARSNVQTLLKASKIRTPVLNWNSKDFKLLKLGDLDLYML